MGIALAAQQFRDIRRGCYDRAVARAEQVAILHVVAVGVGDERQLDALQAHLPLEQVQVRHAFRHNFLPGEPDAGIGVDDQPAALRVHIKDNVAAGVALRDARRHLVITARCGAGGNS